MKHIPFTIVILLLISACVNVEVNYPEKKKPKPKKHDFNVMYAELKNDHN